MFGKFSNFNYLFYFIHLKKVAAKNSFTGYFFCHDVHSYPINVSTAKIFPNFPKWYHRLARITRKVLQRSRSPLLYPSAFYVTILSTEKQTNQQTITRERHVILEQNQHVVNRHTGGPSPWFIISIKFLRPTWFDWAVMAPWWKGFFFLF